jgi:hypothetical protein
LGYSILVYDVPNDLDGDWVAHCNDPVPIVDDQSAGVFIGRDGLRHLYFDCNSAWVIPSGDAAGWYFLPAAMDPTSLGEPIAANLSLVYENIHGSRFQPFRVFYWQGSSDILEQLGRQQGQATFIDGGMAEMPVEIPGMVSLVGSLINQPIWGTVWQAIAPTEAPLSVMLHLYGRDPSPDVADGLGYQPASWLPGDIFIQFNNYGDESGSYLESGLYDFTTGERYSFRSELGTESTVRFYPQGN